MGQKRGEVDSALEGTVFEECEAPSLTENLPKKKGRREPPAKTPQNTAQDFDKKASSVRRDQSCEVRGGGPTSIQAKVGNAAKQP